MALPRSAPLVIRWRRTRDVARQRIQGGDGRVLDPARTAQEILRVILEALPSNLESGALGDFDAEAMALGFGEWRDELGREALPVDVAKQPREGGRIGF